MDIVFFRNHPAFSSPYVAIITDFDQEFVKELDDCDNTDITVIRHIGESKAMVFFKKEKDFNWYMLKWK